MHTQCGGHIFYLLVCLYIIVYLCFKYNGMDISILKRKHRLETAQRSMITIVTMMVLHNINIINNIANVQLGETHIR